MKLDTKAYRSRGSLHRVAICGSVVLSSSCQYPSSLMSGWLLLEATPPLLWKATHSISGSNQSPVKDVGKCPCGRAEILSTMYVCRQELETIHHTPSHRRAMHMYASWAPALKWSGEYCLLIHIKPLQVRARVCASASQAHLK